MGLRVRQQLENGGNSGSLQIRRYITGKHVLNSHPPALNYLTAYRFLDIVV
jgi:hypothetical protein